MGRIGGGGGWGGSGFFGPPLQKFTGVRNFKYTIGAQAQSIGTLFGQIGLRGGVCGHFQ